MGFKLLNCNQNMAFLIAFSIALLLFCFCIWKVGHCISPAPSLELLWWTVLQSLLQGRGGHCGSEDCCSGHLCSGHGCNGIIAVVSNVVVIAAVGFAVDMVQWTLLLLTVLQTGAIFVRTLVGTLFLRCTWLHWTLLHWALQHTSLHMSLLCWTLVHCGYCYDP